MLKTRTIIRSAFGLKIGNISLRVEKKNIFRDLRKLIPPPPALPRLLVPKQEFCAQTEIFFFFREYRPQKGGLSGTTQPGKHGRVVLECTL